MSALAMVHQGPQEDPGHTPDLSHHSTQILLELAALLRAERELTEAGRSSLDYLEDEVHQRTKGGTCPSSP